MKIYIIGIGLIGGSMALDIKSIYDDARIFGIDANEKHLDEAIQLGLIDEKASENDLINADLIIVSVPVDVGLVILPNILDKIGEQTLVFDVGSTKSPICEAIANHPKRRNFLACHPIAGTEFSGPKAAVKGLFEGKTNIICEVEKTTFKLQEKAMDLFKKLGMRIRYMDPKSHDKHIAYVSHLSHISSFMLGKTVIEKEKDEQDIFDMAGSGFESTVRLAKSSPAMWTPIFKQNKKQVVKSLEEYIHNLSNFKKLLEEDNYDEVFNEMQNTNRIKEILK
ncbi:prephenate dehydrogenase [Flavobacterium aquatile]|uniref:Prephenate dehydrogenase n=1 Tax=Flavobacterium aquatile LMG 4008 = ATCC 11947 TaxID=1453498 RepID=A0A095SXJ1_9FLAO|nr:prephenate dehydrogenase [Flavobacterium aquatile]KGD69421.1 prephenate dehydrogenase [Flavobacterium aquatile LMG 4008 = ATCC 11947]OXA66123.1 prephenate dehydrogenase [Flavobacterium aquatile LMG 4008 = ATCC 11947]GEC77609.1 prephenate dehydrogenase [Flavobacterium aquatile]